MGPIRTNRPETAVVIERPGPLTSVLSFAATHASIAVDPFSRLGHENGLSSDLAARHNHRIVIHRHDGEPAAESG